MIEAVLRPRCRGRDEDDQKGTEADRATAESLMENGCRHLGSEAHWEMLLFKR
jgi:hypothetical protein